MQKKRQRCDYHLPPLPLYKYKAEVWNCNLVPQTFRPELCNPDHKISLLRNTKLEEKALSHCFYFKLKNYWYILSLNSPNCIPGERKNT